MAVDPVRAEAILREEAGRANGALDPGWEAKIEHLSKLCEARGASKTHIAFLATEILAKATSGEVDLSAIKPDHARGNPHSYSARTLCHSVIVPLSAELGFSLGVSGREPLNNQPYFRMTRLGDDTPVAAGGRAGFNFMLELVAELQRGSSAEARSALQAFIGVRRRYTTTYDDLEESGSVSPSALVTAISRFVAAESEGGKRAQACVAGVLDAVVGAVRVESGRINDPSRHYPGDVAIRSADDTAQWEKAFEVRDKPVKESDVRIFGSKCAEQGVREAAIVMVAASQSALDEPTLEAWAMGRGIGITIFHGWTMFVDQALFWSALPKPIAAGRAVSAIYERLKGVEASRAAMDMWRAVTAQASRK